MKSFFLWMIFIIIGHLCCYSSLCRAQNIDPIEHTWYDEHKTAKIKIQKGEDGRFYGKVVWLKKPEKDGILKVDKFNPDKQHRNDPLVGLVILKGFRKKGDTKYDDGTIYDPQNGKTYSCIITHEGNTLDVRGYIGIALLGRSTKFSLAE